MFVKEWMTADPQTVTAKTPVMEAMQILREGGFRRLPVVENGKLAGIVTDRDLKEATPSKATTLSVYELNYLLSKLTVKDVMKKPVRSVEPDDPIETAALIMEEHKVSGLPVVKNGAVVGILTITDMLGTFVEVLGLREGGNPRDRGAAGRTRYPGARRRGGAAVQHRRGRHGGRQGGPAPRTRAARDR